MFMMPRTHTLVGAMLLTVGVVSATPAAEPLFHDVTAEFELQVSGSSACWADVDRDGWTDLIAGGTLWMNLAGKEFRKGAEGLGDVVAADFDQDGDLDLFSWSTLRLLQNDGSGAFQAVPLENLPATVSLGACWGDFNRDGYPDVYVGGYEDWGKGLTYPDLLLLNKQGKTLELAWSDASSRARGVTAADFDGDGDLDVYVSNYRLQPNRLWRNDGAGGLEDAAAKSNAVATSEGFAGGHSIGAAWGDFNNDGLLDLFAGNFAHRDARGNQPQSRFLVNQGEESQSQFEDVGPCGVFYQESYASPAVADFDNDGKLDLFFTTVYGVASFGRKNNPVLYRNQGNLEFSDSTAEAGVAGLPPTYQAAWADYDQDGDLDLVTAGRLFRNDSTSRSWVAVELLRDEKLRQPDLGGEVRLRLGEEVLTRHVEAGTGQGSQNDLVLHFGLGDHKGTVQAEIRWSNGKKQNVVLEVGKRATFYSPQD